MSHSTMMLLILFISVVGVIFLIMKARLHAFVALIIACLFLGLATGMPLAKIGSSIEAGMGGTLGFIATVLGLGTILGKMLEVSGGAERLARTMLDKLGTKNAHWAMMIVGFICGIPVFMQVGFVLLIPLIFCIALETGMSIIMIGIPVAVSLTVVHCIVPPHPAAMAISLSLHADIGKVIIYGLLVGFPAAVIAGPLYCKYISKHVEISPDSNLFCKTERKTDAELPPFGITLFTILLPLLIMVSKTIIELNAPKDASFLPVVAFIGNPITALVLSAIVSYWTLGLCRGFNKEDLLKFTEGCFGPVAGILLIIGSGGAFNRVILDSGIGVEIGKMLLELSFSPLFLGWLMALIMRVAIGSATVAMMTAAGIIMPILVAYPNLDPALVAVAIGAGATGLSHVNDSGFWIVKEYFGLSLQDMFKTYTTSMTIVSVVALGGVFLLSKILG